MNSDNVKALASLARIRVGDEEAHTLSSEFESILGYVGEVKKLSKDTESASHVGSLRNVMREDGEPHEGGMYTEAILNEAPARDDNYLKVKKIL